MSQSIAVIPARGGSRRIPRKNIRLFHGKPIVAYSIETAKASGLFTRIVVSTDDEEIAEIGVAYGAEALIRHEALARDEVGTQEVTRAALVQMGITSPSEHIVCCIYATSPLVLPSDLLWAHALLVLRPATFCVAVCSDPLCDAGAFYWGTADNFINREKLYSSSTAIYPLPISRVCDINEERDWLRAEQMYAQAERDEQPLVHALDSSAARAARLVEEYAARA